MCSDLDSDPYLKGQGHTTFKGQSTHPHVRAITYVCIDGFKDFIVKMFIYPRIIWLPIKHLVFPIFLFLTSGSVQYWSGSTYQSGLEKNKMFSKNNGRGYSRLLDCLVGLF